ncbi:MAG: TolC family protein, partial [Spirochaetaceae bacterium]|nr:TolC family protein [Spirochaetaceae bacterium]
PDTLTVEAGSFGTVPIIMPATDTVFEMSGNTYYDFKLIIDQPVFTWGKIYNAYLATKEGAAAAGIETLKLKDQLKTEIKIYSLTLHHLKEIQLAVSRQKEIAIRLERIAEDSYENGMILQTEYLDTQTKRSEAELTGNIITEQINQIVLNLTYITGVELTAVMIETENIRIPELQSWNDIFKESIQNNSDLSLLRHSIKAEEYKTKIQKGTYYFKPDLAFHMELSYSGSYFPFIESGWNDKDKGNLTLTVGIKAPLADFGTMYASVKESEEELAAVRASYEYNREQVEKFIRQTSYEIELNLLNIRYFESRLETDSQMMDQKEKEWTSGYGDEKDYLMQQINYYSNLILFYQEQIKLKTNYYKLENVRGNVN